jgi:inorganic pyrophosphatase
MNTNYSKWRPHPWHGISPGPKAPSILEVFIEITQYDLVKYELDKGSGFLRVDRSQLTSSLPPSLYGFIPQTYSGTRVAALMPGVKNGDGDPMDICVICERPISRAEVIVTATVVGGLPMIDDGFADDKIIAVLQNDPVLGHIRELEDVPEIYISRLIHYFSTYKMLSKKGQDVHVGEAYNRAHAEAVIQASLEDYRELLTKLTPV